jgi:hypothetical protein
MSGSLSPTIAKEKNEFDGAEYDVRGVFPGTAGHARRPVDGAPARVKRNLVARARQSQLQKDGP